MSLRPDLATVAALANRRGRITQFCKKEEVVPIAGAAWAQSTPQPVDPPPG